MAEGLLRGALNDGQEVGSAGTGALLGHPADESVRTLLADRGIDVTTHRARQATVEILRWADLVLVMEQHHLKEVFEIDPTCRGKSFLTGHWQNQFEIADPYRRGHAAFEQTLEELDRALAAWLPKLA